MEDSDWVIVQLKRLWDWWCQKWPSVKVWIWHNPAMIPAWLQGIAAIIMVWALMQNSQTMKANNQALALQRNAFTNAVTQLTIEQETRLNPELECGYNWVSHGFVLQNVGDADAYVTFLHTDVYFIQASEVQKFNYAPTATIFPPLTQPIITPGGLSYPITNTTPDFAEVAKAWKAFGGDVLIRLYVSYERTSPTFHKYSGYFYFTMENSILDFNETPPADFVFLLTGEEAPYLHKIVETFNATPEKNYYTVFRMPTNSYHVTKGLWRDNRSAIVGGTNGYWVNGSWAKLK